MSSKRKRDKRDKYIPEEDLSSSDEEERKKKKRKGHEDDEDEETDEEYEEDDEDYEDDEGTEDEDYEDEDYEDEDEDGTESGRPALIHFERIDNPFGLFEAIFNDMPPPPGPMSGGGPKKKEDKLSVMKKRIEDSKMTPEMKQNLLHRLSKVPHLEGKQEEWYEQLLSIPFGVYSPLPVDVQKDDVGKYFLNIMETLNKAVYGMDNVKEEIINYIAQCLTSTNPSPRILALQGIAGCGKTQIVRNGIAKVLGTPMQTFSMGGIKDSSHFVGFDYTYQNSKYGAIVQTLIDAKVMNPIIFLDELDKISDWYEGEEVKNLLIHMTDPVQNHEFKDKYFDGINIDLSRVIFIFAFNDIDKVNPILKDRLHIIKIANPTDKDKLVIANNYIIDEILKTIPLKKTDFNITEEAMMYIIKHYSNKNTGIRSIKDCLRTILLKINTLKLLGRSTIKKIGLSFDHEKEESTPKKKKVSAASVSAASESSSAPSSTDKVRPSNPEGVTKEEENYKFPIVVNEKNVKCFLPPNESVSSPPDERYLSMYM